MELKLNNNSFVVFDLDDTLYDESSFLLSGFQYVAKKFCPKDTLNATNLLLDAYRKNENAFEILIETYSLVRNDITVKDVMELYRNHPPLIKLRKCAFNFIVSLKEMKIKMGIITDGRSITQRNKLKALGIFDKIDFVLISEESGSEKPSPQNFEAFYKKYGAKQFIYFGDNPEKDFLAPNLFGWKSICIKDSGKNIHKQNFNLPREYLPQFVVDSFCKIEIAFL